MRQPHLMQAAPLPGDRSSGNQSSPEEAMPELALEEERILTGPTGVPPGWGWWWVEEGQEGAQRGPLAALAAFLPPPSQVRAEAAGCAARGLRRGPCRVWAWDTLLPAPWQPLGLPARP